MIRDDKKEYYRSGIYLCTADTSLEADILESKLFSEGVPVIRKYIGASNFLEIAMGQSLTYPIELYVPEEMLEDALNIIVPVPLEDDDYSL
ncbi:MAG: hypothetical protein WCY49_02410 [Anaerovoracaceae bacterium]|nr:hypothetical protein [Clostridiales bacterium]